MIVDNKGLGNSLMIGDMVKLDHLQLHIGYIYSNKHADNIVDNTLNYFKMFQQYQSHCNFVQY